MADVRNSPKILTMGLGVLMALGTPFVTASASTAAQPPADSMSHLTARAEGKAIKGSVTFSHASESNWVGLYKKNDDPRKSLVPSKDPKTPVLMHGRGAQSCPAGSLCLFRDINFNVESEKGNDRILVVPEGSSANDFAEYGFDHSDDGVSSVVNATAKGNTLFSKPHQTGNSLSVKQGKNLSDLTLIPFTGGGNWNDQVRSALADYSLDLSVKAGEGTRTANPGDKVVYRVTVTNNSKRVTDAFLRGQMAGALTDVQVTGCDVRGGGDCHFGTGTSGNNFKQPLTLEQNAVAHVTVSGKVKEGYKGNARSTVSADSESRQNQSSHPADSWNTDVREITADLSVKAGEGTRTANPGDKVVYKVTVTNNGKRRVTDAFLQGNMAKALTNVEVTDCKVRGWAEGDCGTGTSGNNFKQPLTLEPNAVADVTVSGKAKDGYAGNGRSTFRAGSESLKNESALAVDGWDTLFQSNLAVSDELRGSWSDWETGGEIYSHRVTLKASRTDVRHWEVTFDVPQSTKIKEIQNWIEVVEDGSNGRIVLRNKDGNGAHIVPAGSELPLDFQILHPTKDDAYKTLSNLTARQID